MYVCLALEVVQNSHTDLNLVCEGKKSNSFLKPTAFIYHR